MGQGPRFSPLWLKALRPTSSNPPSTLPSRCLMECPGVLGRRRACQGSCVGLPSSCAARRNTQAGTVCGAARRLGRSGVRPRHGAGVHRPGMHSLTARGASTRWPGTSSTQPARRGAASGVITCKNMLGTKPGSHSQASCAATASSGRRLPRSSSASRRPLVLLSWPAARPRAREGVRGPKPCLRLARPHHDRLAQPPGSQGRDSRRRGGALCSLQRQTRLDGRHTQGHIAWRRRAREHEEPRSSDPSRGGSSAARWPAHRHGKIPGGAPRRHRSNIGKHSRGEGRRRWPRRAHIGSAV
jgi:hypothetical protein